MMGPWAFGPGQRERAYTNPPLYADYPDPDIIRVGEDFYFASTTFANSPGLVLLHSKDLVNWETVGYVIDRLDGDPKYDLAGGTAYRNGVFAPSLRYHKGAFYVAVTPNGKPTRIYYSKDIRSPWKPTAGAVRQEPVQDDERARLDLERQQSCAGQGCGIEPDGLGAQAVAEEAAPQRPLVAARCGLQAAVLEGRILEREPEAHDALRLGGRSASWWQITSPPIRGCLKMYMDWSSSGRATPSAPTSSASAGRRENRSKTGSRSWSAWPTLLIERSLACRSLPSWSNASSSKKNRI